MSSMQTEPVDEFAAATEGLTEGYFHFRYRGVDKTTGQYGAQHRHRMEVLDGQGVLIDTYAHYTEIEMKRGNRQWAMMEGFLGRRIEAGEVTSPSMIRNKVAKGFVELNKNDKPKVISWGPSTLVPTGATPAQVAAQQFVSGLVAAPVGPRPLPPRPGTPPQLLSEEQRARIFELQSEIGYDLVTLNNWIHGVYPRKTVDTLTPLEAADIIAQLEKPF